MAYHKALLLDRSLFLLYANDLPQSLSDAGRYFYADDDGTCIFYQLEGKKIENALSKEFSSLCQWFINNKLSVYFEEDKTRSNLFSNSRALRDISPNLGGGRG